MPRARYTVAARKRHKKILKKARGNYGGRSRLYRTALETVNKGLKYAYRDRRNRKREFRSLWIIRISDNEYVGKIEDGIVYMKRTEQRRYRR